jgi:predicted nucleotidyltransferase
MPVSEAQLETWSKPGAVAQSRDTYAVVKNALEATDAPFSDRDFTVFLQGSYANDTNVYAESDVDVVICLSETFYYDLDNLSEGDKIMFEQARSAASYSFTDFKQEVISWLRVRFGASLRAGDKAIFIPAAGSRRNADVLVAAHYRRYQSFRGQGDQNYDQGICLWTGNGIRIVNFPKQHSDNCTTKHQNTGKWFKPVVRIFKNLRNRMVVEWKLEDGLAPSYYIEGLLYNVPNDSFGKSYEDSFVNCFNWLINTDRSNFVCANEKYYLLWEGSPVTWRAAKCDRFLNAIGTYWNA